MENTKRYITIKFNDENRNEIEKIVDDYALKDKKIIRSDFGYRPWISFYYDLSVKTQLFEKLDELFDKKSLICFGLV